MKNFFIFKQSMFKILCRYYISQGTQMAKQTKKLEKLQSILAQRSFHIGEKINTPQSDVNKIVENLFFPEQLDLKPRLKQPKIDKFEAPLEEKPLNTHELLAELRPDIITPQLMKLISSQWNFNTNTSQVTQTLEQIILKRLLELNLHELLQVQSRFFMLQCGSTQFISAVFWEIVRRNSQLATTLINKNINLDRAINTLVHFAEFRTTKRRYMYFNFGPGLTTMIKSIIKALQKLGPEQQITVKQMESLIAILKYNYLPGDMIYIVSTKCATNKIKISPLYLSYMVQLGATSRVMYDYAQYLTKIYLLKIETNEIKGLLPGEVSKVVPEAAKHYLDFSIIENLISALWSQIYLYEQQEDKPMVDYMEWNLIISKINSNLMEISQKINFERKPFFKRIFFNQINQINRYILLNGKSFIPNQINIKPLLKGYSILITNQHQFRKVSMFHNLYRLEKLAFKLKYEQKLQEVRFNQYKFEEYQGFIFDYKLTLDDNSQVYITSTGSHYYNTNVSSEISKPHFQETGLMTFQKQLLDFPHVTYDYKSVIQHVMNINEYKAISGNDGLYFDQLLGLTGTAPQQNDLLSSYLDKLQSVREEIRNLKMEIIGNQQIVNDQITKEDTNQDDSPETYQLSDEE